MSKKFSLKPTLRRTAAAALAAACTVAGITGICVTDSIKAEKEENETAAVSYDTPAAGLSTEILLTSIDSDTIASIDLLSVSPVAQENAAEQEVIISAISSSVEEISAYVDSAYESASAYSEAEEAYQSALSLLDQAEASLEAARAADSYVIAAMYVQEVETLIDDAAAYAQEAEEEAEAAAIAQAEAEAAAAAAAEEARIDNLRQELVDYALSFVGVLSYKYGGASLTYGADCSGFTMAIYAHFGYSLPHSSSSQAYCGRSVSVSEIEPGDLVCYYGHVGIYIGGGMIVHSPQTGKKVTTISMYYRTIRDIRRIIE